MIDAAAARACLLDSSELLQELPAEHQSYTQTLSRVQLVCDLMALRSPPLDARRSCSSRLLVLGSLHAERATLPAACGSGRDLHREQPCPKA